MYQWIPRKYVPNEKIKKYSNWMRVFFRTESPQLCAQLKKKLFKLSVVFFQDWYVPNDSPKNEPVEVFRTGTQCVTKNMYLIEIRIYSNWACFFRTGMYPTSHQKVCAQLKKRIQIECWHISVLKKHAVNKMMYILFKLSMHFFRTGMWPKNLPKMSTQFELKIWPLLAYASTFCSIFD